MNKLPITFALFTSTKGHWGRKTDYRLTLNHWNKQIPLVVFGRLVAHLKVTPGDEDIAKSMREDLTARGFQVIETMGDWNRGLSHGDAYLCDQITVSKNPEVYSQPYFMLAEDDSPVISHKIPLDDLLTSACQKLANDHEMLTARFMRRGDDKGPGFPADSGTDYFWSEHVNFQPIIMRSLDYYRLCLALEQNPLARQQVQCEMLWRLILQHFSRSHKRHLVWETDYAEALHIGVKQEDYDKVVAEHKLI
jgi:hypothetical protein